MVLVLTGLGFWRVVQGNGGSAGGFCPELAELSGWILGLKSRVPVHGAIGGHAQGWWWVYSPPFLRCAASA